MANVSPVAEGHLGTPGAPRPSPLADQKSNPWFDPLAAVPVIGGIFCAGYHLAKDLSVVRHTRAYPYILLGIALLIALGFEFVNGFQDTANAVATVIDMDSLSPNIAVIWSGFFKFPRRARLHRRGRIRHRLAAARGTDPAGRQRRRICHAARPADRCDSVDSRHGWFGLPSSSSHTLIGSIIGVDRAQATKIGQTLLVSLVGFSAAWLLLAVIKAVVKVPALYREPVGNQPPPLWIRRAADPHLHGREPLPRRQ